MSTTDQHLESLKKRFSPALAVLDEHRAALQNLRLENNKLLIRGVVPDGETRDRLLRELERIDPEFTEVLPDIRVPGEENVPHTGQSKVQSDLEFSRD